MAATEPEQGGAANMRIDHLEGLEEVVLEDSRERVERVLDVACRVLDMEVAYFSKLAKNDEEVLGITGRVDTVAFDAGTVVSQQDTYCSRMLEGDIPSVIPDTAEIPELASLDATEINDLRAYIGVPVQLSDGRIFGTLCCLSHEAKPTLSERDSLFMRVLARLLADELERKDVPDDVSEEKVINRDDATARLSLWFAGAPKAAPAARQALQSLTDEMDESTLYTVNLLVTELVTNSVRHAGIDAASAVGLDVEVGPSRVRATVTDPGPGFAPQTAMPDPFAEGGRGMPLVDSLAERWGVESEDGTQVWFELAA